MGNEKEFMAWIEKKYAEIVDGKVVASKIKLDKEVEDKLFEMVKDGNSLAEGFLFLRYERTIDAVLNKYSITKINPNIPRYEYESACVDTVLKSIREYIPNDKTKFISYLMHNLENAISRVNQVNHYGVREANLNTVSLDETIETDKKKSQEI